MEEMLHSVQAGVASLQENARNEPRARRALLLLEPLREALRCLICRDTVLDPAPLHFALCCRQLIGCQGCVERLEDECPHCRAENFRTIAITNFDFVQAILSEILDEETN